MINERSKKNSTIVIKFAAFFKMGHHDQQQYYSPKTEKKYF